MVLISLLLLLLLHIKLFHISTSWWSFTGDWETASLLKSPGLFSVFWPFSIMLLFGWSPLILSVLFCGQPGQQSRQFCRFSSFFFFLLIIIRSGLLAEIKWSVFISKPRYYYYYYYYYYLSVLINPFYLIVESNCFLY